MQSRDLMMVGLGVQKDRPPNDIQPPLTDGIHLRWAFKRERGFPWHGYYLLRRDHRVGKLVETHLSRGKAVDEQGRAYRVYGLEEPAYGVRVQVRFLEAGQTEIAALMWGTPVSVQEIAGGVGDSRIVDFFYDTITSIRIPFVGAAVDFEVLCVPVSAEAGVGWEFVPDFPYAMRLPVSQAEYPCTPGIDEDLPRSRSTAGERIRYGESSSFTGLPASTHAWAEGEVSVTNGSFLVAGHDTRWDEARVGWVLQVRYDLTAYTVVRVLDAETLVLSRPYVGPSREGVGYVLHPDHFGQLHDQLVQLVSGGSASGLPMAQRSLPQKIDVSGSITLQDGSPIVQGVGTAWAKSLVGLDLQVVGAEAGMVDVQNGFKRVTGVGTGWRTDLAGMSFQVAGDSRSYTIATVESSTDILLEKPFSGASADEAPYRVFERAAYAIESVFSETELHLARPYHGPGRTGIGYAIFSALQAPGTGERPWMPQQSPLDMVLLGSLHPAIAQMLGLYWVDQEAEEKQSYDYLILADHVGLFRGDPKWAMQYAAKVGQLTDVDGYIVFDKVRAAAQALSPPEDMRAYALPAGGRKSETPNNAGLTWDYGGVGGVLLPDQAVMAHLWRADLGETEPADAPADDRYRLITQDKSGERPVLVSAPHPGLSPERPADWPPFPLMAMDRELEDGWYSYRVSGIDIFGRHSKQSHAAHWYQWDPVPDPKPWYYRDPAGHVAIHSFAVRLLDKMPPPPPAAIEAFALDPADPTVVQDAAYLAWRDSLGPEDRDTLVGLRVRWLWTLAHRAQSPDTREFRIYYHPDRQNALPGSILEVSIVSLEQSDVTLKNPGDHPAHTYVGALLQTGPNAFKILEASGDSELLLRVNNIRPHYRVGTIAAQDGSATVEGTDTAWRTDLTGMVLQFDGETSAYRIAQVLSPTRLTLEAPYTGTTEDKKDYQIFKIPRPGIPCSLVFPSPQTGGSATASHGSRTVTGTKTHWGNETLGQRFKLAGEYDQYRITGVDPDVDPDLQQITLDHPYTGRATGKRPYAITHPLFMDYRENASWYKRIHVVGFNEHVHVRIPAMRDDNGYPLTGPRARVTDSTVFLLGSAGDEPSEADLSTVVETGNLVLYLENDRAAGNKRYPILLLDNSSKKITVAGTPDIGGGTSLWIIGPPVDLRFYEVFLPAPGTATEEAFAPSLADPIVYAHVGVSAADGRAHTADHLRWAEEEHGGWVPGERFGNEGPVGPAASIFRVLRDRPEAPRPPPADSDRVYATPADYHGKSFYTYRWLPVKNLETHIFRALDDAVFKRDWAIRTTRNTLDPVLPRHASYFPQGWLKPDTEENRLKREHIADELNAIDSHASYGHLSNDARTVLALLPGNEGQAWNNGLQESDWKIRQTRGSLTADQVEYFPQEWLEPDTEENRLKREHVADEFNAMVTLLTGTAATVVSEDGKDFALDGNPDLTQVRPDRDLLWLAAAEDARKDRPYRIIAVDPAAHTLTLNSAPNLTSSTSAWAIYLDSYRELSNDALRVLAGLPGNERAFTQITIQPLDAQDASTFDDRGPDDPEGYIRNPDLRIYIDTLPGRSSNRYFYRAAYVDGAQNRSHPSLASPPVYLPKVTPPRTPVITKVLGGDRKITLHWNCSREPDLVEYRVYRTEKKENARDIHLMTVVQTQTVPSRDPTGRPTIMQCDDEVQGFLSYYYRLVAIDSSGNVSRPSKIVAARAFDHGPPAPAEWRRTEWGKLDAWENVYPLEAVVWNGPLIVSLEWMVSQTSIQCLVQRRQEHSSNWIAVSPWLSPVVTDADNRQWEMTFSDKSVLAGRNYWYRIVSVNKAGKPSVSVEASPSNVS